MVKQTIQIFARLKPTKTKKGQYEISEDTSGLPCLNFFIPRDANEGIINNKKEVYKFSFQHVFDVQTKQDEVFERVAQPVIDNVLQGYNGTIFAYGQTGSGKTFTITGGAERYSDRGIIPRSLSYIFDYYKEHTDCEFTTMISYLEIYNENGYDLLDPKHEAAKLDDLPKVMLMEDAEQNIHLKNLSSHQANNEEEALNLLFVGDTNRMIAETPMNQASTRSHCIFTIHVMSRVSGSATIRRSKLHLVDLAGSERVSKTGVHGLLLTEAKYINLSLHYLEQVIIALSESRRQHIPYRNSMMTSVLRDSLGGNCMTTMIANCAVERSNVEETISTCQFAQRVALIRNDAVLNEELSPKLMIDRLRLEVQQLKNELVMVTGESKSDALTEEEMKRCDELVKSYLVDDDPEAVLMVDPDWRKIHFCFRSIKRQFRDGSMTPAASLSNHSEIVKQPQPPSNTDYDDKDVHELKDIILQRDNEISVLCKMLRKEKTKVGQVGDTRQEISDGDSTTLHRKTESQVSSSHQSSAMSLADWKGTHNPQQKVQMEPEEMNTTKMLASLSIGRQQAFELFRRDYEHGNAIEANKQTYKDLCSEAKHLGEQLAHSKAAINKMKSSIKQHQASLAVSNSQSAEHHQLRDAETRLMQKVEEENVRYKETFNCLRVLKSEIDHIQHLLEIAKVTLLKDFDVWWTKQTTESQNETLLTKNTDRNADTRKTPSSMAAFAAAPQTKLDFQVSDHVRPSSAGTSTSQHPASPIARVSSSTLSGSSALPSQQSTHIPLTGDADADEDIRAFLLARQNIIRQAANRKPLM